jgi:GMP synthase-like glutamine amidotransferase
MKIAVLLTNTDRSAFAAAFPNDGEKVIAKLRLIRPGWTYQVLRVVDGEFPKQPQDFDGYVITGSPASVNDSDPWVDNLKEFIRQADRVKVRMTGLCFGHQAIAAALGGKVGRPDTSRNFGWGLGFASTRFTQPTAWMQPPQAEVRLLASHGEQVLIPPAGAKVIGSNDFCPVAAMTIGEHLFTTEYHPEMSVEFMDQLVVYLAGELPTEVIDQAREQLVANRKDDSALFMKWVINFFERT